MSTDRTHFRVEYPVKARPVVQIKKKAFPIINISESGVLFALKEDEGRVTVGRNMKGVIVFSDNEKVTIEGKILRNVNETVAMHLTLGISLKRIMTEQRWLLTEYGTLKQPNKPEKN